jgi:hypothetical protein
MMEFFNSLSLDVKMLVVAGIGALLMALSATDKTKEKRYTLVMVVLLLAATVRHSHVFH